MPPLRRAAIVQAVLAVLLLSAAIVLGGGQGTLGDTFCQLLALAMIGLALWRHANHPEARLPVFAWFLLLPLALPLLQWLLPLPEMLWRANDARAALADGATTAGTSLGTAWGLIPSAAERGLFWLLPALAMAWTTMQADEPVRRRLLQVFVVLAVLGVVLGLAQLAGGPGSELRFYEITNQSSSVGFFANRNHFASQLAMALPFAVIGAAVSLRHDHESGLPAWFWAVACVVAALVLILGLALARSRAGMLLGVLALLLSAPLAISLRRQRSGVRRTVAAVLVIGAMLTVQFGLFGILQSLEKDPLEDSRIVFAEVAAAVARENAPIGTGMGGFRQAFEAAEVHPKTEFVNHAHNDYAELWLEGGWLAIALMAFGVAAFFVAGWRVWKPHGASGRSALGLRRAAWISLLLVLLHSFGDYPLRTTANLAVLGLLVACLIPSIPLIKKEPHGA